MNHQFIEARELIVKARESLRRGDKLSARQLGEQAALLMPDMEDVWLILAASDPNSQEALAYARKALEINPQSTRAQRAVEWASSRLKRAATSQEHTQPRIVPNPVEAASSLPNKRAYQTAVAMPALQRQGMNWLLPILLIMAGLMAVGFFAFVALTSPMLASVVSRVSAPVPTQENLWAPAEIAKPGSSPINVSAFIPSNADNGSSTSGMPQSNPPLDTAPTATEVPAATQTPTDIATEEPASTEVPAATATPGSMVMEIVNDTPTSESSAPVPAAPGYASGNGERWIDVDLTNQSVYAYEGDAVVNSFIVSTGTWLTPTVTGQYKVYVKYRSAPMSGPGYYLPDVPYIMYFYKSYGLHGTYWHHNFGTPMSHGCVNLQTDDAAWLYNWASVGTVVNVHY
jgi:lipoprotein-anchoring transpeptidase ErfK/SrfK